MKTLARKKILTWGLLLTACSVVFIAGPASAQQSLKVEPLTKLIKTDISAEDTVIGVIGTAIRILLGFSGVIGLIYFIYGGLQILLSRGNDDMVEQGKKALTWAVIGLVIVFSSYLVLNFVLNLIKDAQK